MSLKVTLGKYHPLELETPIYNASGCNCTTDQELLNLNSSQSGLTLTKSSTLFPNEGNQEPKYYSEPGLSINSNGLENYGIDFYISKSPQMNMKPYIISIAGFSVEDKLAMIDKVFEHKIANPSSNLKGIEINFSCPNLVGKGSNGNFDYDLYDQGLKDIFWKIMSGQNQLPLPVSSKLSIGLKMPPIFYPGQITQICSILNKYIMMKQLDYIVCCNSLPNGFVFQQGTNISSILPKNGLGGIGGSALRPISLSNVMQFYEQIGDKVDIVGCGGADSAETICQYFLVGATAVQVGTYFKDNGSQVFEQLNKHLSQYLIDHNCNSYLDAKGQIILPEKQNKKLI